VSVTDEHLPWTNWAGNESCRPQEIAFPRTEDEVSEIIASATRRGLPIRVVGAGHSFSTICLTDGVLISLDRMNGIVDADTGSKLVRVRSGTRIRDFGDPLWGMGLCLKNQGDIDSQHIAGAISTATHGSGIRQQCFSATARRFRVVLPSAEAIDVTEDNPELLAAMQVSLGLLGVITEVELKAREAFAIAERIEFWPLEEILARWDNEMSNRRHFSFFWMPAADSPDRLFMDYPDGLDMTDWARVKLYDELPASSADERGSAPGVDRLDRPYRIYPDPDFQGEIAMRELEYMVPFDRGKDAFLALRELVLEKYPDNKYPIEIRSIGADNAYLSPFYERDSISVSICGHKYLDYRAFLADVATTLDPFEPRPHWGKIHYMNRQRLQAAFPQYGRFLGIRERLDPSGTFLGPHLSPAFG
jgi:FAD/FMN-containing dehydrogenase